MVKKFTGKIPVMPYARDSMTTLAYIMKTKPNITMKKRLLIQKIRISELGLPKNFQV
jgi:hypothetical protein